MSLKLTIEKASAIAGSQTKLAELIGEHPANVSGFKRGTRYCGYKKRAAIAAIAGENVARAMIEAIAEDLDDQVPHEAEAKAAFMAILRAFPIETDEEFIAQKKNGPEGPSLKVAGGNGEIWPASLPCVHRKPRRLNRACKPATASKTGV